MKSKVWKFAFVIVLLCVVVPVGAGYLLPSDTVQHITSESDGSVDLTSSLSNTERPVYTTYTGSDNNAYFMTEGNNGGPVTADATAYSTTVTPHPVYSETGSSAQYVLSDTSYPTWSVLIETLKGFGNTLVMVDLSGRSDTTGYEWLAVYLGNENVTLYTPIWASRSAAVSDLDGLLGKPSDYGTVTVYRYDQTVNNASDARPVYRDAGASAVLTSYDADTWTWYNGYRNNYAAFTLDWNGTIESDSSTTGYNGDRFIVYVAGFEFPIYRYGSTISVFTDERHVLIDGVSDSTRIRLLFEIDASAGTISFTSLMAWNGTGSYDAYKGYTYTYAFNDDTMKAIGGSFTSIGFKSLIITPVGPTNAPRVHCESARIANYSVAAMKDASIDTRVYEPDGLYIIEVSNTTYYGSGISFDFGSYKQSYNVQRDGTFRFGYYDDGDISVVSLPASDIVLSCYRTDSGYQLTLNGYRFYDFDNGVLVPIGKDASEPVHLVVTLKGTWGATVTAYHLTESTRSSFEWTPGGFSISWGDYCLVGMLTAFLSFVACGLAGRRSGSKVGILLLVSAICGFTYLVLYI